MKRIATTLMPALALTCAVSTAQAAFVFDDSASTALPGNNYFATDLQALGYDSLVIGEQLSVNQTGTITFHFIGSESGYDNSFNLSGTAFFTEQVTNYIPLNMSGYDTGNGVVASINVTAGDVVDFSFSSSSAAALSPVDNLSGLNLQGLGIIFDSSAGSATQLILAYDDQTFWGDDDNHDDMLILAEFSPVPVPGAAWLFGSALLAVAGMKRK